MLLLLIRWLRLPSAAFHAKLAMVHLSNSKTLNTELKRGLMVMHRKSICQKALEASKPWYMVLLNFK